jgi:hypothetical protein
MERERGDRNPPLTAVPSEPSGTVGIELRVGPNPLLAGAPLHLRVAAGQGLQVFDLTGRRVAAVASPAAAGTITIPGSVTRGWNSGVYFVRAGSARARASFVVIH